MIQAAAIKAGDSVLEIGSGSGYAAAVISQMGAKLIGVERQHDLVEVARERLHRLGYGDVKIVKGDGTKGCAEGAPFNAILAAASGTHIPGSLLGQLTPDGRIIMPIGSSGWAQQLIKVTKQEDGVLKQENLGAVRFVPLIGEEGWKDA
jgi:protein-L-isoaspartate(D-aspartate) O-methyltransferase